MYQIATTNAINNDFVNGDVATGQSPTQLNAQWFSHIQNELVNLLVQLGGQVDQDKKNQLAEKVKSQLIDKIASNKAQHDQLIGSLMFMPASPLIEQNPPTGYIQLNGGAYEKNNYPLLWQWAIDKELVNESTNVFDYSLFQHNNLSTSDSYFRVPRYDDYFIRIVKGIKTRFQEDAGRNITGGVSQVGPEVLYGNNIFSGSFVGTGGQNSNNTQEFSVSTRAVGGFFLDAKRQWGEEHTDGEFRGKNVGVTAFIKYK